MTSSQSSPASPPFGNRPDTPSAPTPGTRRTAHRQRQPEAVGAEQLERHHRVGAPGLDADEPDQGHDGDEQGRDHVGLTEARVSAFDQPEHQGAQGDDGEDLTGPVELCRERG